MSPNARAGLVAGGIATAVGVLVFVGLFIALGRDGKDGGDAKGPAGIDREKVLGHMTNESDAIIYFSDRGEVVRTDFPPFLAFLDGTGDQTVMRYPFDQVVEAGKHLDAVKAMKGRVMATYCANGRGNRFSRKKAEAILADCIKEQSP